MTQKRVHTIGEKPVNPWIDDVVRVIDDIREEPPLEECSDTCWSFIITETISLEEWKARQEASLAEARAVTTAYELILEAMQ